MNKPTELRLPTGQVLVKAEFGSWVAVKQRTPESKRFRNSEQKRQKA